MFSSVKNSVHQAYLFFLRRSLLFQIVTIALMIFLGYRTYSYYFTTKTTTTVQTTTVRKGSIRSTVTASGQVVSTNNSPITTLSSGVITKIYVANGDTVQGGDKIADLDLDISSKQRYTQALASYQNAKNALESAKSKQFALQAAMFEKWDTFKELAESGTYTNSDNTPNYANRALPEFHVPEKEWLAAEADYKNQAHVIAQTQSALSAAWYELNESSPTIYSPISGTVTGLSLQEGTVIPSSTTTSTTSTSKNQIAHIVTNAPPTIQINVTEIDVNRIHAGQRAEISLDAFPDRTLRGIIYSVDTVGTTTSGVTTYPVTITLKTNNNQDILPNMSGTSTIIIEEQKNVLVIPLAAISTKRGISTVTVQKNGKTETVKIKTGLQSDTEGEVISGLKEGDMIVTGTATASSSTSSTRSSSPFSPVFGPRR